MSYTDRRERPEIIADPDLRQGAASLRADHPGRPGPARGTAADAHAAAAPAGLQLHHVHGQEAALAGLPGI
jgi:hypothetical protein